jgi:hypothetical protein
MGSPTARRPRVGVDTTPQEVGDWRRGVGVCVIVSLTTRKDT